MYLTLRCARYFRRGKTHLHCELRRLFEAIKALFSQEFDLVCEVVDFISLITHLFIYFLHLPIS